MGRSGREIPAQAEIQFKPLAKGTLLLENADMGPETQPPHHDAIPAVTGRRHSGSARWLKQRSPVA
jgi:hypothetical protein